MKLSNVNPYVGWCNMSALLDKIDADIRSATDQGPAAIMQVFHLIKQAGDEWGWEWPYKHKMKCCEGTPFQGAYLRLQKLISEHKASKPKSKRNEKGAIYFITMGMSGVLKIGFSTNLDARLKSLKTSSPTKIVLLLVINGTMAEERALHKRFASDRVQGEWFRFSDEIRGFIQTVKANAA